MERTISDTYLLIPNLSYHNILQSSGMFHVHRWRLGHVHHLCGKKNEVFVRKFAGYSFRGSSLRIPVRKKKNLPGEKENVRRHDRVTSLCS